MVDVNPSAIPGDATSDCPFWLSDEAWAVIAPQLPRAARGARRVDDRRVISGILYVLRTGLQWKDSPAGYGPPATLYTRFRRWSLSGLWWTILASFPESAALGRYSRRTPLVA